MTDWFNRLNPFRADSVTITQVSSGLSIHETDDAERPMTFRFQTGDGTAQYSLTHRKTIQLASTLNAFLKKGPPQ